MHWLPTEDREEWVNAERLDMLRVWRSREQVGEARLLGDYGDQTVALGRGTPEEMLARLRHILSRLDSTR